MSLLDLLLALLSGLVIFRIGLWAVRALAAPTPESGPADLVPVQANYRCGVCGTRVTMTHAPGSEMTAPKHCREPMDPA